MSTTPDPRPTFTPGRPYLSETDRDLIRLANEPGYGRWYEQIRSTGGCAHPVYLAGHTTTYDPRTGLVLRQYSTTTEPGGRLAIRCRNRRETVCPTCSRLHAGDTFHLIRAGLTGGKGTPATVRDHPRLFVTLTAPSFGPVHRADPDGKPCRPRRDGTRCEHEQPRGCPDRHVPDDRAVGQPLCPACYDYIAHALWHAHAGELWNRTTRAIRRHLAATAGIPQSEVAAHVRLSFAKVAEYQRRGAVHFHAVVRLDGPTGPEDPPPTWASTTALEHATRQAAAKAAVMTPYVEGLGEYQLRWGGQLDAHPIRQAFGADEPVTDQAVAAYVAKYVTKSIGDASGTDRPLTSHAEIALLPVTDHVRTLMHTCWRLGALPHLQELRLRPWAHTLGYRGHILTKSRRYSTTYAALRDQRAAHVSGALRSDVASHSVVASAWRYAGSGYSPAEALVARGIAQDRVSGVEARKLTTADVP